MSKPNFKVSFSYGKITPFVTPTNGNYVEITDKPRAITTTTCLIEDNEGVVLGSATVMPIHSALDNKLTARKEAFKKSISSVQNRGIRTTLWKMFRKENIQPENGRVRIRTIESLIKKFPGISTKDYDGLAKAIREVLLCSKNHKDTVEEKEKVFTLPNAEPLASTKVPEPIEATV